MSFSKHWLAGGVALTAGSLAACTALLGDFSSGSEPADASNADVRAPDTGVPDAESDGTFHDATYDASSPPHDSAADVRHDHAVEDARGDAPNDAQPNSDAGEDASGDACASAFCATTITANGHHSCATMADGTLRCWGSNDFGESGPNANGTRNPTLVSGLGAVRYARAGLFFTCAFLVDDSVWCWGSNGRGSLGQGDASSRSAPDGGPYATSTPLQVIPPGLAAELATGQYHACITTNGTPSQVLCWGDNASGQSGVIDASVVLAPTAVPITNVFRLGLGASETCMQRSTGAIGECIGDNTYGELGRGLAGDAGTDNLPHPTPAAVAFGSWGPLSQFVHSTGDQMGVVLQSGQIATWGADNLGQLALGDDSGAPQTAPALVPSLNQVTGMVFAQGAGCALRVDTTVWCWGSTAYGETGSNASNGPIQYTPIQIPGLAGVTQLTAGYNHFCALLDSGSVDCWGWNASGELGRMTTAAFDPTPMPVEF